MTQEVGSQKRKGQMQMWREYEQTANQSCYLVLTRLRDLFTGKDPNSGLTMTMRLRMMGYEFASSWLRNSLQKWTTCLSPLLFLALSESKKFPEGTKIC
jgi:hypothetical protein